MIYELNQCKNPQSKSAFGRLDRDMLQEVSTAPRTTRLFSQRPNYYYWSYKNKRKQKVRYCYTTRRNIAGFFVGWVETTRGDGMTFVRRQWCFRRKKNAVMDLMKGRWEKAKHGQLPV